MICKKRNAMQIFCMAGIVMGAVLLLAGCSGNTDKKGNKRVEKWDGAKADRENGLRVKEAVYHDENEYFAIDWTITYDAECNITGVKQEHNMKEEKEEDYLFEYTTLSSLLYNKLDLYHDLKSDVSSVVEKVLEKDGCYYDFCDNLGIMKKNYFSNYYQNGDLIGTLYIWDAQARTITTDSESPYRYTFSEDGYRLKGEKYEYGRWVTDSRYSYDETGRLISVKSDDVTIRYVYEKDLLLSSSSGIYRNRNIHPYETYEYEHDLDGNIIGYWEYKQKKDELERELISIRKWEYDENGNLLLGKTVKGHRADSDGYYESYEITQYDEKGNITEESTQISIGGKEYTVKKTEHLYDKNGKETERNYYRLIKTIGSSSLELDELADWCRSGKNTELYITAKYEFKYTGSTVNVTATYYKYEANADFSKVNLLEETIHQGSGKIHTKTEGYWTITYYTDEEIEQYYKEIEQYLHDQEFSPVN